MPTSLRTIEIIEHIRVHHDGQCIERNRIRRICATPTGYLIAWFTMTGEFIASIPMTDERAVAMLEEVYVNEVVTAN